MLCDCVLANPNHFWHRLWYRITGPLAARGRCHFPVPDGIEPIRPDRARHDVVFWVELCLTFVFDPLILR